MKIPLSVSESAGLRMPVKMLWGPYNLITSSAYLMTEKDAEKTVEALRCIRENIDATGGTVGSVTYSPAPSLRTTLHYKVDVQTSPNNPFDDEVVLLIISGETTIV